VGGEIQEDLDGPHLRQALLEATGGAREPEPEKPAEPAVAHDPARVPDTGNA